MAIDFTIDGRALQANEGETVMRVAQRHGIEIPHFCYHGKLSIAGNCRLCLVKVNGLPKLVPACNLLPAPGMAVDTRGDEVARARRQVMQFIMLNHPVDCGICDKAGECTLQNYQRAWGSPRATSAEPKIHRRKLYPLGRRISLDNERCILCSRCVRFTQEVSGSGALGIVGRGADAQVDRVGARPFDDDPYSDNVIGLCPTGALLSRDFLYASRVWFLEPVRSVCTGCARVCSLQAWRRKAERLPQAPGRQAADRVGRALRITAFDNPQINGPWLCNKGFDLHRTLARPRVLAPQRSGRAVDGESALAAAHALLAGARRPAMLVSAQASNEELDALQTAFGARLALYAREDQRPAPGEVVEDALLIRADKNPNRAGLRARGIVAAFDAGAGHDLLLVWGDWGAADEAAVPAGLPRIHLASFAAPELARADVLLPLSTHFERAGSFTNGDGIDNAFEPVFAPPPQVWHAAELFARLAS